MCFLFEMCMNQTIIAEALGSKYKSKMCGSFGEIGILSFNGNNEVIKKLKINLNLRPQNLDYETYYILTKEYEALNS